MFGRRQILPVKILGILLDVPLLSLAFLGVTLEPVILLLLVVFPSLYAADAWKM